MSNIVILTELPHDAQHLGYRQDINGNMVRVYYSPSHRFAGTEQEFVRAGHAYRYKEDKDTGCTRLYFGKEN